MNLGIDSSSSQGSVSLVHAGETTREVGFGSVRGRGSGLHEALHQVLSEVSQLDAIVVGTGPGSYNGIRSAIATAWGISLARRVPLHGVPSLLAIAEGEYCTIGDARRGQFYFAIVRDAAFVCPPELFSPEEIQSRVRSLGPVPIYTPTDLSALIPGSEIRAPSATRLASLQHASPPSSGIPEPIYLKAPHITQPKA